MPRYFFDAFDGADIMDDIGTELPNLEATQRKAAKATTELLSGQHASFWIGEPWTMRVREGLRIVAEISVIARVTP